MVAPVEYEYRRMIENRMFTNSMINNEIFLASTKFALQGLFNALIDYEFQLETIRKKFRGMLGFNYRTLFDKMTNFGNNFLTELDVSLRLIF